MRNVESEFCIYYSRGRFPLLSSETLSGATNKTTRPKRGIIERKRPAKILDQPIGAVVSPRSRIWPGLGIFAVVGTSLTSRSQFRRHWVLGSQFSPACNHFWKSCSPAHECHQFTATSRPPLPLLHRNWADVSEWTRHARVCFHGAPDHKGTR